MKRLFTAAAFMLLLKSVPAQNLIKVTDVLLTVKSPTAKAPKSGRVITAVQLPEKIKGYVYRISIFPIGKAGGDSSLFDLLQGLGAGNIVFTNSFYELRSKNEYDKWVHAKIFLTKENAGKFSEGKDIGVAYCKFLNQLKNCCFGITECMSKDLFFGFWVGSIEKPGVDVRFEVVAVVDN